MTQENKELLLKDLCARLPYGVKYDCMYTHQVGIVAKELTPIDLFDITDNDWLDGVILYLRPMSSMTEEEKYKLLKFGAITCLENGEVVDVSCVGFERHADVQDYLNTCHFDYRGLIEGNLALEAPDGMYNINEK